MKSEQSSKDFLNVLADHPQYRHLTNGASVESPQLPPEPSPKTEGSGSQPRPLAWSKPVKMAENGDGYMKSTCERFAIVKETSRDFGLRYGAMSIANEWHLCLGWRKTSAEAKELCERARKP